MHIMEGFLPVEHTLVWPLASAPFVAYGTLSIKKQIREKPQQRMLLGVAAAFAFIISALKLPSLTGSCSHPTGAGLGANVFFAGHCRPVCRHDDFPSDAKTQSRPSRNGKSVASKSNRARFF